MRISSIAPQRFSAFVLAAILLSAPVGRVVLAQQPSTKPVASAASQNFAEPLAAIEKAIDQKRKELGIPGLSLLIVKDDRIISAGEVVAQAEHSTWDKLIATRIFKPLGMRSSDTTAAEMQKARDYSYGYEYNSGTKQTRRLPRSIYRIPSFINLLRAITESNRRTYLMKRLRYSVETMNALTISASTKFPLNWFNFVSQNS
jgi:CubicO group peptidase (beta-lactamase class C family)